MNRRKRITNPVVARGDKRGPHKIGDRLKAPGLGLLHFDQLGFGRGAEESARPPSSSPSSRSFPLAFSSALDARGAPESSFTLARKVDSYWGSSSASCVICTTSVDPSAASRPNAATTVRRTAGVRQRPELRSSRMTGATVKLNIAAMTSGSRNSPPI